MKKIHRTNRIIAGLSLLSLGVLFFAIANMAHASINPSSLTSLKLWLDASQGATTDGTTAATDGQTVQQWNDSSGNGYNATQGTAGSRPTYKTNIFNSNPVLRFDGGDTIVTSSFLDSTFNTALTFFIVENKVDTSLQVATSNQGVTWYSGRTTTPLFNTNGLSDTSISAATDQALTGTAVELFRYDGSSKFSRYQITPDNYFTRESATGNLGLSGSLTIGALSSGAFGYVGDIAEVIAYNRALSGYEMSQVETYLLKKYVNASHASTTNLPQIIFDGDSLTDGVGSTSGETYPKQTIDLLGGTTAFRYYNQGVSGQTTQQMIDDGVSQIDPLYSSFKRDNIVVLWGGTNDLYFGASAATTYSRIVEYATARRAAGYKVIVTTILPRSGGDIPGTFEADRQTVNTNIRNNWATFADAVADVAANTDIGEAGDDLNLTYYPDGVHLNNTGYAIVADLVRDQIVTLTADTTAPTILNITSNKANATYGAAEVIDIDVTFSEVVTSTGNVTVTLETGATDRTCTFTVTSDTTGTCNYTVQAGDSTADLTVSSVSGTINDASSNAMVSFTPTTNLAANKAIVISTDATAPTITNVSSDKANGSYTTGEVIDIDVTFSEAVTSTGNVTVTLETGATDRTCTFTVSSSTTGTCNYTVQAGDTSADLTVSSISGTINDAALNAMSNFVPATNLAANKALVVDTTAPGISNLAVVTSTTTATFTWTTDEIASSQVSYGLTTSLGTNTAETDTTPRVTSHSVTLTGLQRCKTQYYTVTSKDASTNTVTSSIATFRTKGCSTSGGDINPTPVTPAGTGSITPAPEAQPATPPVVVEQPSTGEAPVTPPATQAPVFVSNIPLGFRFNVNMKFGQSSNDVRLLQEFLKEQGTNVYPEGLITGYFGALTKKAVIRFQELYASKVLAPVGLSAGNGFVGSFTRAQINNLLSQ